MDTFNYKDYIKKNRLLKEDNGPENYFGDERLKKLVQHMDDVYLWQKTITEYRTPFNSDVIDKIQEKNEAYRELLNRVAKAIEQDIEQNMDKNI